MFKKAIFVLIILSLTPFISLSTGASERPQNIILFGWDGAQRDHVAGSLDRGELPNLQKLIDEGKFVNIDIEGKTDTDAGWSQILSGYYPEVTGVYSNDQYQPIPEGLSIFERLKAHFGPDKFIAVALIADANNLGIAGPTKTRIQEDKPGSQTKAEGGKTTPNQANAKKKRQQPGSIMIEKDIKYLVIPGQPF